MPFNVNEACEGEVHTVMRFCSFMQRQLKSCSSSVYSRKKSLINIHPYVGETDVHTHDQRQGGCWDHLWELLRFDPPNIYLHANLQQMQLNNKTQLVRLWYRWYRYFKPVILVEKRIKVTNCQLIDKLRFRVLMFFFLWKKGLKYATCPFK